VKEGERRLAPRVPDLRFGLAIFLWLHRVINQTVGFAPRQLASPKLPPTNTRERALLQAAGHG